MGTSSNVYIHTDNILQGEWWTNWNGGLWTGSRITMGKETADKLNIFLGILILFVEAGFWSYAALALFLTAPRNRDQRRRARDAFHHQLQATFRNVGGSLATLATLWKLFWVWRWRAVWRRRRTSNFFPAAGTAAISLAFFVVGMPFILAISMLDSQSVEALIKGGIGCGFWVATFTTSSTTATTLLVNQTQEAVSYVDLCYNRDAPSNGCDFYLPTRSLDKMELVGATCPFSPDACLYKNQYPAYTWQTVPLNSHVHFGINAKPKDRILLQRTTTCAPLDVDRFSVATPGAMTDEVLTGVYFGPSRGQNYTYMVSNYESVAKPAYHMDVVWSNAANGSAAPSTFTPIKDFVRRDADVSIVFLNNQGIPIKGTDGPCRDPFFSATNQSMPNEKNYYLPDHAITAIGCTDQYAFGNPVTGQWTKPMSSIDTSDWGNFTKDWHLSVGQTAAIASLAWSLFHSGGIEGVILGLETDALLAKKYPGIFSGFQNPIPNDQWKKEVGYWFNIGLAKLQFGLINIAVGPQDPTLPDLQNMLPTLTVGQEHLARRICNSQKIYSPDHKNYNAAGLIFLLVLGGLIGLLPVLKPYLLREQVSLDWNSYSTFQMQRMAIESGVAGKWEYLDDDIPRLRPHDALAGYVDLEYADPNDPARQPHPEWSDDAATPAIHTGADASVSSAADSQSEDGAGRRRSAEGAIEMQPLATNASPNSRPTGQQRGG